MYLDHNIVYKNPVWPSVLLHRASLNAYAKQYFYNTISGVYILHFARYTPTFGQSIIRIWNNTGIQTTFSTASPISHNSKFATVVLCTFFAAAINTGTWLNAFSLLGLFSLMIWTPPMVDTCRPENQRWAPKHECLKVRAGHQNSNAWKSEMGTKSWLPES